MPSVAPVLLFIFAALLGYLFGSFPTAIVASKLAGKPDPRTSGSGNMGATNAVRTLGFRWGLAVGLFDAFKGAASVLLARFALATFFATGTEPIFHLLLSLAAGVASILGHIFPVFAGFRGGKGVATATGVVIALWPLAMVAPILVFVLVLLASGYVSLASISGTAALPICLALLQRPFSAENGVSDPSALVSFFIVILLAIVIIALHHKNIRRLLQGEEHRFEKAWVLRRRSATDSKADEKSAE